MTFQEKIDYLLTLDQLDDDTYNNVPSFSYAASVNPNILSHKSAKKSNDYDQFKCSMKEELDNMQKNVRYKEVPKALVPYGQ